MENQAVRFFVSFSSRDLKYVREIMAALNGQQIQFWDYSDVIQSIELAEVIDERLIKEIDSCTHVIVVLSENSMDSEIGKFCRVEFEHALQMQQEHRLKLIPVLLHSMNEETLPTPYDIFQPTFIQELDDQPESLVQLTIKLCELLNKVYVPPIKAHPNLPFWELFRKEVEELAHSNKAHVDIIKILGAFTEHYKKGNIKRAYFLIQHFLSSCEFSIPEYQPFYPVIVKAVCETELGQFNDALESYGYAELIDAKNQDIIGGKGTVYYQKGEFEKAKACFQEILQNNQVGDSLNNAQINLIITLLSMGASLSKEEEEFLFSIDLSPYSDDFKTKIYNAQAIQLKIKGLYHELEQFCKAIRSKNLHDTITIRLLQISYLDRKMQQKAKQTIIDAIKETEKNSRLDRNVLKKFLYC